MPIAALATIGGFIIHLYMGLAVVPEGLHAIVHGDVTEEWARHHHALWLAQVQSAGVPPTTLPSTENDTRSRRALALTSRTTTPISRL